MGCYPMRIVIGFGAREELVRKVPSQQVREGVLVDGRGVDGRSAGSRGIAPIGTRLIGSCVSFLKEQKEPVSFLIRN